MSNPLRGMLDFLRDHKFLTLDSESWREAIRADAEELHARNEVLKIKNKKSELVPLFDDVNRCLTAANEAARNLRIFSGTDPERAREQLDTARLLLLEATEDEEDLKAWGPDVSAMVRQHLGTSDPRRQELERVLTQGQCVAVDLSAKHKGKAVAALRAAQAAAATEQNQARSFRIVLRMLFWILSFIAVAIGVFGALRPKVIEICFHEPVKTPKAQALVCAGSESIPNSYDVLVVELIGVAAAALTASFVLRRLDGTATAYSIPFALAMVKMPSGAISAFIGIVFLGAGVVPGVGPEITREEVFAWAAIFGAGQQFVTRLIDMKGREVLDNVRGAKSDRSDD